MIINEESFEWEFDNALAINLKTKEEISFGVLGLYSNDLQLHIRRNLFIEERNINYYRYKGQKGKMYFFNNLKDITEINLPNRIVYIPEIFQLNIKLICSILKIKTNREIFLKTNNIKEIVKHNESIIDNLYLFGVFGRSADSGFESKVIKNDHVVKMRITFETLENLRSI